MPRFAALWVVVASLCWSLCPRPAGAWRADRVRARPLTSVPTVFERAAAELKASPPPGADVALEMRLAAHPDVIEAHRRLKLTCDLKTAECLKDLSHRLPSLSIVGEATAPAGAAGISWEATVLTGLANFMVDRANQELVLWLVTSFQQRLCADSKAWFPATCALVKDSGGDGLQLPGTLLASAVRKDLEALPLHSFQALFVGGEQVQSLIDQIAAQRRQGRPIDGVALLKGLTPALKQDCGSGHPATEVPCAVLAAMATVVELGHLVTAAPWDPQPICAALGDAALRAQLEKGVKDQVGSLPEGIAALLAELKEHAPDCAHLENTPKSAKLVALLEAAHALVARLKKVEASPPAEAQVQAALQDLEQILALIQAGAEVVLGPPGPAGSGLTAAEVQAAVARALGITRAVEGLYSVFQQLRKGEAPLELLAGLGDLAQTLPICRVAVGRAQVGCTLLHVGALVGKLGRLLPLAATGAMPQDAQVCLALHALASDRGVQELVAILGDKAQIPGPLGAFLRSGAGLDCGQPEQTPGYPQLLALARAVLQLHTRVFNWNRNPGQAAPQAIAGDVLRLVMNVIKAGADVLGRGDDEWLGRLVQAAEATGEILRGGYADGIRDMLGLVAVVARDAVPEGTRRYLTLLADIAMARDPKDVAAALSAAAAPVGSWRLRRQGFNISVTGVLGLHLAGEWPLRPPAQVALSGAAAGGPMALLGVEFSGPTGRGTSLGLLLSVLDLGQLAWARISNTGKPEDSQSQMANVQVGAKTASEVSFLNVLSPGAYLKLGLPKMPLSLGVGASFVPQLRTYLYLDGDKKQNEEAFSMVRVGGWLAVDLNLFPIYLR